MSCNVVANPLSANIKDALLKSQKRKASLKIEKKTDYLSTFCNIFTSGVEQPKSKFKTTLANITRRKNCLQASIKANDAMKTWDEYYKKCIKLIDIQNNLPYRWTQGNDVIDVRVVKVAVSDIPTKVRIDSLFEKHYQIFRQEIGKIETIKTLYVKPMDLADYAIQTKSLIKKYFPNLKLSKNGNFEDWLRSSLDNNRFYRKSNRIEFHYSTETLLGYGFVKVHGMHYFMKEWKLYLFEQVALGPKSPLFKYTMEIADIKKNKSMEKKMNEYFTVQFPRIAVFLSALYQIAK